MLQKEGAVFKCYDNPWDARYYSDSGASLALLKARACCLCRSCPLLCS